MSEEIPALSECGEGHPTGHCGQCDTATEPWYDRPDPPELHGPDWYNYKPSKGFIPRRWQS